MSAKPTPRCAAPRDRPIPSGRLNANRALAFGIALAVAGFAELAWFVNLLSGVLGIATLVSYLFLYTPLKQRSWLSTTVGAFPGAMPPMIGFAAASGTLTAEAWVLFAILFLWQFPHFYAIAWMYREDYARAGIRMLPVVEPDGHSHRPPDRSLRIAADSGEPGAGIARHVRQDLSARRLGARHLVPLLRRPRGRPTARILRARSVLLASVIYLPLLYGLMLLDRPGL